MRSRVVLALVSALMVVPGVARADHVPANVGSPQGFPSDRPIQSSGDWRFVGNFPMGPAQMQELGTDVETFVRDGKTHTIVGSMTLGFRLFRWDAFDGRKPTPLGDYASAFPCDGWNDVVALTQNKAEGDSDEHDTTGPLAGWQDDVAANADGTLSFIATDGDGRCHDSDAGGAEIVDTSNLSRPRLFHLTTHFGEAHTLTFDDARGLIFINSSDTQANFLDIVDVRSCIPPATDAANFANCRPVVARYQFPVPLTLAGNDVDVPPQFKDARHPEGLTAGVGDKANNGCHDLTIQGNFAYCAAINATVIFDISGVMQRGIDPATRKGGTNCVSLTDLSCQLTGTHLTDAGHIAADATPFTGMPPACPVEAGTPLIGKANSVTDCEIWQRPVSGSQESRYENDDFMRANLRNANLVPLSVIRHNHTKPPTEDIDISHEADPTEDGTMLIVTDERGGGLTNTCDGRSAGGGGAWFFDIRDKSNPKLLRQPDGSPAVFITDRAPVPGNCTIHVITQVPGLNVIVAGWYIEGTHVFAFTPDLDAGIVSFSELGHYVPGGTAPQTWTSYPVGRSGGTVYIQTGDMTRGSDILAFEVGTPQEVAQCLQTTAKGNVIVGTSASETLKGTNGRDIMCGFGGKDTLRAKKGKDLLFGGTEGDVLRAGRGNDLAKGGQGRDKLRGGFGKDKLLGQKDRDNLRGHNGPDVLRGGPGNDKCRGAKGNDRERGCER